MPKQIILEYPWKAVYENYNGHDVYDISHYCHYGSIMWRVYKCEIIFFADGVIPTIKPIDDIPYDARMLIHQCQTELNNQ